MRYMFSIPAMIACAQWKFFESQHRPRSALDSPVVLFNDVVKKFALANLNVSAGASDNTEDGRGVGATFVNRDRRSVLALFLR